MKMRDRRGIKSSASASTPQLSIIVYPRSWGTLRGRQQRQGEMRQDARDFRRRDAVVERAVDFFTECHGLVARDQRRHGHDAAVARRQLLPRLELRGDDGFVIGLQGRGDGRERRRLGLGECGRHNRNTQNDCRKNFHLGSLTPRILRRRHARASSHSSRRRSE